MNKPKAYSYVRFSSKRQERGSSVERQTAASREFAKRRNLDLQDVTYSDLGVSAFRGRHAKSGALRAFVEAVEEGKIETGSWLLVESLDRISREQIADSQARISSLLGMGITIATIADGQVYKPSSRNNLGDAIAILVSLSRSHEESMMKSQRSRGGWAKTRRVAKEGQKHPASKGGILPMWLRKTGSGDIETIPEQVAIVQRIYAMALEGLGSVAIANSLNGEGIKTSTDKPWSAGSISKLLTRRFVLGEWQPHTTTITDDGKRVLIPDGDPIQIYPQIITEADWIKVQKIRQKRDSLSGRAASGSLRNVFSGLARCACGAPMRFVGRTDKSPALVCRTGEYGQQCDYRRSVQYRPFEALMIASLSTLNYAALFPDTRTRLQDKADNLHGELLEVEAQMEKASKRRAKAAEELLDNEDELLASVLREAAANAEKTLRELTTKRETINAELGQLGPKLEETAKSSASLQQVADLIRTPGGREKVNRLLKNQVEGMTINGKAAQCHVTLRHSGAALTVEFEIKPASRSRPASGQWRVVGDKRLISSSAFGAARFKAESN